LDWKNRTRLVGFVLVALMFAVTLSESTVSALPLTQREKSWRATPLFHVYLQRNPRFTSFATSSPTGLTPSQVVAAYNLPSTGGNGTIAIIDAYSWPTALNDFVVFSNQFGLPNDTANFEIHPMATRLLSNAGWALESALDVEWAHAIAPNAKILLVQARSDYLSDLLAAVNYARNRADVVSVSMSWGGEEFSGQASYNSYFANSQGTVFFASSGDSGAGVIWPAASANVVGVGGTTLTLSSNGSVVSETGWSGSGGGVSAYEAEPQYQVEYNVSMASGKRCVPDVSYDADPATGFSVYDTTFYNGQSGWFKLGGTSAGSPQWAAIQSLGLTITNENLYQDAESNPRAYFRDITSGSNGAYSALPGYDLVTGLGSPVTNNFEVTKAVSFALSSISVINGGSGYTTPVVLISGGGGSGASAVARVSNGVIVGVTLISAGSGYTSAPALMFRDPSPRARGAIATANLASGLK
jgi:subtilase family serine protease